MGKLRIFLRDNFKKGDPVRIVANHTQANRIANILNDIDGIGCRIEKPTRWDGRGWKIVVDAAVYDAASKFSGTAYVAGEKTEDLNSDSTKPWVKCDLGAGTASEQTGPPSNPLPANQEWYEKANTCGDIHESRA